MAGSQTLRLRRGRFAAILALSILMIAGHARAQNPTPPLPPAGVPASSFADVGESVLTAEATPAPMTVPGPTYYPHYGVAPTAPRVEMGIFDTIIESLFGDASAPGKWRPLSLGNFFSEGWLEPWAAGRPGKRA